MPREAKSLGLRDTIVRFSNGTELEAPAFGGVATQWTGGGRGLRSPMLPAERDVAVEFDRALAEVGVQEQETIHFDVQTAKPGIRATGLRGAAADRFVLRPAPPPRNGVQVVWYQDESGGVTWHLPDGFLGKASPARTAEATKRSVLRASRGATFTIQTRTAAAQTALTGLPAGERLRGPIVKLGRKIFKVLVVPLSKLIAKPVETIVAKIERQHRQELVRPVTLQNYRALVSEPFTDWSRLDGKPSLLIVHGIFSSTHGMLSGLPSAAMARLLNHYGGRVIALDQLTVTRSAEQNAADFLRTVAAARPQGSFTFDVLCHSRGGIVARTLAERGQKLVPAHPCAFRKVFFVAAPNAGSPLGDAAHMLDMINVFTNLLTNFPDGPALYSLEVLLALIKLLAYAAETRLPGIRDMSPGPDGYIATTLNAGASASPAAYAAVASNYEPRPQDNAFFNGRIANSVIDRIFNRAANDLVVPRDGVYAANGHPSFPIEQTLVFKPEDHVWHTDYFTRPQTLNAIARHFGIAGLHDTVRLQPAVTLTKDEAIGEYEILEKAPSIEDLITPSDDSELDEVDAAGDEGGRRGGRRGMGGGVLRAGWSRASKAFSRRLRGTRKATAKAPIGGRAGGDGGRMVSGGLRGTRKAAAKAPHGFGGGGDGGGGGGGVAGGGLRGGRPNAAKAPRGVGRRAPRMKTRATAEPAALPIEAVALERHPAIDFHEQVREGDTKTLTVRFAELAAAAGAPLVIPLASGDESVGLDVRLYAPGFAVQPRVTAPMMVHRRRDPKTEKVQFRLRARRPGTAPRRREITAEFWLRNALLGAVTHFTVVVPKDWTGPAESDGRSKAKTFAIPEARRQDCDLILMIDSENTSGEGPFRLRLRSAISGNEYASLDCGLLNLPQKDLSAYVKSALDGLIDQYPDPQQMSKADFAREVESWQTDFLDRLRDLGKQLWGFLPERFRKEYFRFYQENTLPSSIGIYSDEMLYPWELVLPNEVVDGRFVELPYLGVGHVLGRWKTSLPIKPTPQRLRVDSFVVVNPGYPPPNTLPWSATETGALKKLFPKVEVFSPSTAAGIRAGLLRRNNVRLLHFSGHGTFDSTNADLSELVLERGTLNALAIAKTKLGKEGNPIFYLNACSVGALGVTVGRAGGFVASCVEGGFSGVIAPYWPVNDARAAKFSIELYQRLLAGRAIGEALRDLRDEHQDDATYLAFTFFGDPWTRVNFDPVLA
jgi:hypothetical protein